MTADHTQSIRLLAHLEAHGLARARELRCAGIAATTISREVKSGRVERLGRGLYRLPPDARNRHEALAEIAKRAPNAVICLKSAMHFHEVTNIQPERVWIAIGYKDWAPKIAYPPIKVVRFREDYLRNDIEKHVVMGVELQVYSLEKTLADSYRNKRLIDRPTAIAATKVTLHERRKTVNDVASAAIENGAWRKMQPYLEAMTVSV